MELKIKLTFFFQNYVGEVTKAKKGGKFDKLFSPLEAL